MCNGCVKTLVVSCPQCGAKPNQGCTYNGHVFSPATAGTHGARRQRFDELTELELAVIRALRAPRVPV